MVTRTKGMAELFKEVINKDLCALCGACIGDCPYTVFYRGKIRMLDLCTREEGHCYGYCPRTHTDFDELNSKMFGAPFSGAEIGSVKEVFMARSKDARVRSAAQYGGTVTSLLLLALENGRIDAAVTTRTGDDKLPTASLARSAAEVMAGAGSSYMAYPVLEQLNRVPGDSKDKLGIVVTPCQAIALARMRLDPPQRAGLANLRLTIGLFCTWALAYDRFYEFLKNKVDLPRARKFDIPPPPASRFDVYIGKEVKSFPLDEVRNYRMHTCAYCLDMTAEYTDISVGSVEGVEGWNTVIVRTQQGADIVAEAKKKGKLEIKELPSQNLVHLKEAAFNKKARAVQEIVKKTGDKNDLMYVGISHDLREKLLGHKVGVQGGH